MEAVHYYLEKIDRLGILARKYLLSKFSLQGKTINSTRIFIAGMQRSGTNMVMDILERSLETDTYHERDARAFDNYQMRDRKVIRGLIEQSRAEFFIIKALCESQYLHSLLNDFEPSKALWVVRNYEDAVNSMMISFPGFTKRIKLIVKDRNSCGWRSQGMSDETHALLRNFYHDGINEATAAALKWYYRNILFFQQKLDDDDRVKLILYEHLVTNPKEEAKNIFEFLGPKFHSRVVYWVSPRSIRRRPPPEIEPGVKKLCDQLLQRFLNITEAAAD
jgi:hypothetical protein